MQATFPQIREEMLAEHSMDDFMYLHLDYQPYAPQTPGGCGLWFSMDGDSEPNILNVRYVILEFTGVPSSGTHF